MSSPCPSPDRTFEKADRNNKVEINFINVVTQYVPLHTPPSFAKSVTTLNFGFSLPPSVGCSPFHQTFVGKAVSHATGPLLYTLKT